MSTIVYSEKYDIKTFGFGASLSFDFRRYSRTFTQLQELFGNPLRKLSERPAAPLRHAQMTSTHPDSYFEKLDDADYLAEAFEVPLISMLPVSLVHHLVLKSMRWACAGTLLAAELALRNGFAINLGGGYHHAKPNDGEGFCIYNDIALAIRHIRNQRLVPEHAPILYVDLDAHQGNGVCHCFASDRTVVICDAYNSGIYPRHDAEALQRIDYPIPLRIGTDGATYLAAIRPAISDFLDEHCRSEMPALLIYNSGSDILQGDPLGLLSVPAADVIVRDHVVVSSARVREIPTLMLLSGGYTHDGFRVVADSIHRLIQANASGDWAGMRESS